jgi:hypothetical protein
LELVEGGKKLLVLQGKVALQDPQIYVFVTLRIRFHLQVRLVKSLQGLESLKCWRWRFRQLLIVVKRWEAVEKVMVLAAVEKRLGSLVLVLVLLGIVVGDYDRERN